MSGGGPVRHLWARKCLRWRDSGSRHGSSRWVAAANTTPRRNERHVRDTHRINHPPLLARGPVTTPLSGLASALRLSSPTPNDSGTLRVGELHNNFPTVDAKPPYSEHFARDFGGATLGIALLPAIAVVSPQTVFVIPATLAYSVCSIPHFFFHLTHLDGISTPEAIGLNTVNALGALLGLTTIVLSWATRSLRPGRSADAPNVSSTTP